jgi:hypothetical protein
MAAVRMAPLMPSTNACWAASTNRLPVLRDARGRITRVDVPGAVGTNPYDLNDRGQVVGVYLNAAGVLQGVLLDRGRAVTIAAPGIPSTIAAGINNRGRIVGITTAGPARALAANSRKRTRMRGDEHDVHRTFHDRSSSWRLGRRQGRPGSSAVRRGRWRAGWQ